MKEGSLFVLFVPMKSTELGCFRSRSWSSESSRREKVHGLWFHDVWTCCAKVLEYWMISWTPKIELNHSWKFRRNWNVPLVLLERSWWAGYNEIYLVRFGFRMWEILILKWFLPPKIQNKFQKTRFWKEKSVEDEVTLGPTAQVTLVNMKRQINMCIFMSMILVLIPMKIWD